MYAKLFRNILLSSVWAEDDATRILWITLLAEADKEGFVFGSLLGLAHAARLTVPQTENGLARLSSPDKFSGDLEANPSNEGRRLEVVPGGWRVINYAHYRDIQRSEDRRQYERERKASSRKRAKMRDIRDITPIVPLSSDATTEGVLPFPNEPPPVQPPPKQKERGNGAAPQKPRKRALPRPTYEDPPTVEQVQQYLDTRSWGKRLSAERFVAGQETVGWMKKNGQPVRNWRAAAWTWASYEAPSGRTR